MIYMKSASAGIANLVLSGVSIFQTAGKSQERGFKILKINDKKSLISGF